MMAPPMMAPAPMAAPQFQPQRASAVFVVASEPAAIAATAATASKVFFMGTPQVDRDSKAPRESVGKIDPDFQRSIKRHEFCSNWVRASGIVGCLITDFAAMRCDGSHAFLAENVERRAIVPSAALNILNGRSGFHFVMPGKRPAMTKVPCDVQPRSLCAGSSGIKISKVAPLSRGGV